MTMWRSSLLAMAVASGLAGGATLAAADGPSGGRAEFPNIPWTWSGFYAGLHVGSADAQSDDGLLGGVHLGRNWQSGKIVYGLEGDVSMSGLDGVDWFATARGRVGYLITSNVLLYGTAGLGFVNFDGGGNESEFVAGLGVEGKLTEATSVRLEYLNYTDTDIDVIRAGLNFKFNW
jgi:outer membrane immunogenic protein